MSLMKYILTEQRETEVHEDEEGLWEIYIKNEHNQKVGEAYLEEFYEYNWDVEDVMSEDEFYKWIPTGVYISLRDISVEVEERGKGYATELMNKVIEFSKESGWEFIHLNASSKDNFKGMSHSQLVNFYKKFGFEVVKNQGNNSIMIAEL